MFSAAQDTSQIPEQIGGYRVTGMLGRGASGIVFRVHDEALDRDLALKLLADLDPESRERFAIEAKAAARIIDENVVQVFGFGEHEGHAFILQELVEGATVSELIRARERLEVASVIEIGLQAASGLSQAEQTGVLHRDIKPDNLLLTMAGNVKIADFGLAKLLHAPTRLTHTGTTLGTPHYMSPEQGRGETLDARSDQYALGATLYHALVGAPPFDHENALALLLMHVERPVPSIVEARPECPPELAAIIERTLQKDPAARFASFQALVEALESIDADGQVPVLGDLAIPSKATGSEVRLPKRSRSKVIGVVSAAAALAILAVFGLASFDQPFRTTGARAEPKPATREADPIPAKTPPPEAAVAARLPNADVDSAPPKAPERRLSRFDRLIKDLEDPARARRAAVLLGRLGDHRATKPLLRKLQSRDARVAIAAADALAELGDIQAIEPLDNAAADSKSAKVRAAAARARARLWSVETAP